jgi:mono/diheme cytochrome c family protein
MSVRLNRASLVSRAALVTVCGALGLVAWGCSHQAEPSTANDPPRHAPSQPVASTPAGPSAARGRYLVLAGGCNDCHTPGFMQMGMKVPESLWVTGVPIGWKGPWGTTYGSNLRLFAQGIDEQTFLGVARQRNARPPMPWESLHAMSDDDLRSIFRYFRQLGPAGVAMPADLAPGETPKTPYVDMTVHLPGAPAANAQ